MIPKQQPLLIPCNKFEMKFWELTFCIIARTQTTNAALIIKLLLFVLQENAFFIFGKLTIALVLEIKISVPFTPFFLSLLLWRKMSLNTSIRLLSWRWRVVQKKRQIYGLIMFLLKTFFSPLIPQDLPSFVAIELGF